MLPACFANSSVTATIEGRPWLSSVTASCTLHDVHDPQVPSPEMPHSTDAAHFATSARVRSPSLPTRSPVWTTTGSAPSRRRKAVHSSTISIHERHEPSCRRPTRRPAIGRSSTNAGAPRCAGGRAVGTRIRMRGAAMAALRSAPGAFARVVDQDLEFAGIAPLEVGADHGPQHLRRDDAFLALDLREVDGDPQARGPGVDLDDPQVGAVALEQRPRLLDRGGDGVDNLVRAHGGPPRCTPHDTSFLLAFARLRSLRAPLARRLRPEPAVEAGGQSG